MLMRIPVRYFRESMLSFNIRYIVENTELAPLDSSGYEEIRMLIHYPNFLIICATFCKFSKAFSLRSVIFEIACFL
jgi:hypothetical protein